MTVTARIGPADSREREIRMQLAACYRLMHKYAMTDLIFTHVSARLPGDDGHFLLNPFGLLFNEITASSLVKVDAEGNVVGDREWGINRAGFVIHGAVLKARADVGCVVHAHTRAGIAVSTLECGLLSISQHAMLFHNRVAYHDYEGLATGLDECARLAADLGEHKAMVLRNHGLLTADVDVGEAFIRMFNLVMACKTQLDAQATGAPLIHPPEALCEKTAAEYNRESSFRRMAWDALVRRLDAEDPSFRD